MNIRRATITSPRPALLLLAPIALLLLAAVALFASPALAKSPPPPRLS